MGVGSAVKVDLIIDNLKSIINGCLGKNEEIVLVLLFLVEDLKDKELNINIKYADVVGLGKYEQNEKLLFKEKNNNIVLSKIEPMSEPMKMECWKESDKSSLFFDLSKIQTCREPLSPYHDKIMAECQK